jgi:hypothetical protein
VGHGLNIEERLNKTTALCLYAYVRFLGSFFLSTSSTCVGAYCYACLTESCIEMLSRWNVLNGLFASCAVIDAF